MTNTRQDFPKARQAARQIKGILNSALSNQGGPTEVAIVSSTATQMTTGYVQGTSRKGPIQIVGVPLNSVVPGMKIFVHQLSQKGLNYYVFDGAAPVPAAILGSKSASVVNATGVGPGASNSTTYGGAMEASSSPLTTIPGGAPTTGWFWSFFFYTPSLPSPTAPSVLLDMPAVNGSWAITGGYRITYDYLGHLNFYAYSGSPGAGTSQSFAPHHVWFITMQLGTGCYVNGLNIGTTISALSTVTMTPANYGMFLLSDSNGANAAPAGSWISKIVFGNNVFSSTPLIPYNQNFIPSSNSQIVTGSATLGSGLRVYNRWLCSDSVGGTTLPDTGLGGETLNVLGQYLTAGPY